MRDARLALLIAPAGAAPSAFSAAAGPFPTDADISKETAGISLLDAVTARALRAYRAAGVAASDGALLRFLRALLRDGGAEALAAAPLAGDASATLADKLLPLAVEAELVPQGASPAAVAEVLGGLGPEQLAAAAADVASHARLARGAPLSLPAGAAAVVTNGRVIVDWAPAGSPGAGGGSPGGAAVGLTPEDFALMHMYAFDLQPGESLLACILLDQTSQLLACCCSFAVRTSLNST